MLLALPLPLVTPLLPEPLPPVLPPPLLLLLLVIEEAAGRPRMVLRTTSMRALYWVGKRMTVAPISPCSHNARTCSKKEYERI